MKTHLEEMTANDLLILMAKSLRGTREAMKMIEAERKDDRFTKWFMVFGDRPTASARRRIETHHKHGSHTNTRSVY